MSKHQDRYTWEYTGVAKNKERAFSSFTQCNTSVITLKQCDGEKPGFYLDIESSGAGDDLKKVVSEQEVPDRHRESGLALT